ALKFTQSGGSVIVSTSIKSHLEVKVKDNGIGVKEADIPFVFDRYYQASNGDAQMQGGTGIGLSLSKEIALLHGGDLKVKSRNGKGSSFMFELPMSRIVS
ncbi:MAG: signal transduction histidine kinase, partial [Flavobacteriaceae bacterium]